MKTTNPKHPPVTSVFSNRPFTDAPDDTGFPFKKSMRRIAGTGTFTAIPRHRKGGRARSVSADAQGMRKAVVKK